MKQTRPVVLLILSLGLLAGCSTVGRRAPVVDRPGTPVVVRPAPVQTSTAEDRDEARGIYVVKKGDTLLRIALDHGQNYRDILLWNNLPDPNDIKTDQVLRIAPPPRSSSVVSTNPVTMPESRPSAPAPAPKKVLPRGEKKPYSEATLAEMKKDDDGKPDAKPDAKPEVRADKPVVAVAAASGNAGIGAIVKADDDDKLSWMWPSDGRIVATFDEGKSKGVDIAGKLGQQVMAAGAGKVMYAGSGIRGYGNLVIVKHSNSLLSAYAHNRAIVVKEGQTVNKGEKIAEMGDSDADSVKLHFEIRQQGKPVDPSRFLPGR
ncbi:peptidoglycan DD-metalloendopeptidase family protein [Massilia sp. DWR3-1-1]|uniref:peptidoglycan DD-metalloendopeptidase family protein n=1 Tax=Massilia sp. DWR3-1-1 TaxID=2804559 RepID=UPI003CF12164